MDARERHHLARLLSGSSTPSRLEKEAALSGALRRTAAADRQPVHGRWKLGLGLLAAAAVALLLVRADPDATPAAPPKPTSAPVGSFTARGPADAPELRLHCTTAAGPEPCRTGSKLAFEVHSRQYAYFAAFARRPDGATLWYFPEAADGTSLPIPQGESGVLERAILLDDAHRAGVYEVHGVFSPTPLSRDQIKQHLRQGPAKSGELALVTRELVIR